MQSLSAALVIVDAQRYYIDPTSPFYRFSESLYPGSMGYIRERWETIARPGIERALGIFRKRRLPVVYVRLCGRKEDRSDLHRFFADCDRQARQAGFPYAYPLASDPFADIDPRIGPVSGDTVIDKTGFGAFTDRSTADRLSGSRVLVMCGLATSQCVDTSARQASDLGFSIIHVEDAQADYSERMHASSLYASQGVCGGVVVPSTDLERDFDFVIASSG